MGYPLVKSENDLPGSDIPIPKLNITNKKDTNNPPPPLNYHRLANLIYKAMKGMGTDETTVYQALQELNQNQTAIEELNKVYFSLYQTVLVDEIDGDFDGNSLEFAMQLLNRGTANSDQKIETSSSIDYAQAATRIKEAINGLGTDEEAVYATLIPFKRDPSALNKLREIYKAKYGDDLTSELMDEFSGSELDYVLFLYFDVIEAYNYYLVKAANELSAGVNGGRAVGNSVIDNPEARYDKEYWEPGNPMGEDGNLQMVVLKLKQGKNPSDAIKAMYGSMCNIAVLNYLFGAWRVDCAEWVQVHHLYAMWNVLGPYRLDERFSQTEFWFKNHRSTGLSAKAIYSRYTINEKMKTILIKNGEPVKNNKATDGVVYDNTVPLEEVELLLTNAPLGSRVGFFNAALMDVKIGKTIPTPEQAGWTNENTMKIKDDKFSAHGAVWSTLFTRRGIAKESIKYGRNPDISDEENINQTIFIGEIEIYKTIADEPWTAWYYALGQNTQNNSANGTSMSNNTGPEESQIIDKKTGKTLYYVPALAAKKYFPRLEGENLSLIQNLEEKRNRALETTITALVKLQNDIKNGSPRYQKADVICQALGKYMGIFPNSGNGQKFNFNDPDDKKISEKLDVLLPKFQQNKNLKLANNDYYLDDEAAKNVLAEAVPQHDYGPPAGFFKGILFTTQFFAKDTEADLQKLVIIHEYFHVAGYALDDYPAMREQQGISFEDASKMAICLGGVVIWISENKDLQDEYSVAPFYVKK